MGKKAGKYGLVVVESPAKARTIEGYLGDGYVVESSVGHIRDLPSNAGEIPAAVRDKPWARLGVNVEEDFEPVYVIPASKRAQVTKLRKLLKDADTLYLACDEDREGEAIAWHLAEVLKPKVPVRRMVFDEITRSAIRAAIDSTRDIDQRLVDAQESRRILDRLYGYEVSPVLWKKVKPKLSAGRVQSVATRLVTERERLRMRFRQAEYWDLEGDFLAEKGGKITATLVELGGKPIAIGRHFVDTTGQLEDADAVAHLGADDAGQLVDTLGKAEFSVTDLTEKAFTNKPYAPFITSSMQQEAGRKLRFTARRTMRIAQSLYENGYITYMRTDSTTLSNQALTAARSQVKELYGDEYLPDEPRIYRSKSKNAQEAHEAIRPAGETFRTPQQVQGELDADQHRLYELIWKRTVASQMKDARGMRTAVRIGAEAGDRGMAVFAASGKVLTFPGFLRAYVEGSDDPGAALDDQEKILPSVEPGQSVDADRLEAQQHFTQPKARYTEASLIRELEERGIGRPSTYASILQTIQDRGYVASRGSALVPTFTAFAVVNLLETHLPDLVDFGFTARMEDGLDAIARGEADHDPWLHNFYFGGGSEGGDRDQLSAVGLKDLIGAHADEIDPRTVCSIPLGQTPEGEQVFCRVGRYGPYVQVGDGDVRATVPDDVAPDELTVEKALELLSVAEIGDSELGEDPETGKPVYLKTGRFGPYVQLGDPELTPKGNPKKGGKPKMASLWPDMEPETVTLDQALTLLSFPREVGVHPESGEKITAQDGRYGPYIKMGVVSRSLPDHASLATITLEGAIELLKQPGGRGRGRAGAALAELGKHPVSDLPIQVKSGRYGPYVTDGEVNATIPKDKEPEEVTLEQAVELIAAREQKMRDEGKDPRAKARAKAAKAKSAPKKKAKAKKKAATAAD